MTPERFEMILEAYGAEPMRWPAAERDAARAFAAERAEIAAPLLAAARALDGALEAYGLADPGPDLTARVVEGLVQAADWRRWAGALGAGMAAACAAGVMFGVTLSQQATADLRTDAVVSAAYGDDVWGPVAVQDGETG